MREQLQLPIDSDPAGELTVISYGLGVDSTAVLLRWINEPASRDFDLQRLIVLTSMTGDEWEETKVLVERHMLPLFRQHGIRFVQVARSSRSMTSGVSVLDDSRAPMVLHLAGAYRLSEEMVSAGTIPQTGGNRLCSIHAKGDVLDGWLARETRGRPFRHAVGFEVGELARVRRDQAVGEKPHLHRRPWYPLVEWGWDRERASDYITVTLGVSWPKSACVYCPYALANKTGRGRTFAGYRRHPDAAGLALVMEYVALCLNPTQGLVGGRRLLDVAPIADRVALAGLLDSRLEQLPHAIDDVRRVYVRRADQRFNTGRSVRKLTEGSRQAMQAELLRLGPGDNDDGITRVWQRRSDSADLSGEWFYVVAPAVVDDKVAPTFAHYWPLLTGEGLTSLPGVGGLSLGLSPAASQR
jgi:hypothetical protein